MDDKEYLINLIEQVTHSVVSKHDAIIIAEAVLDWHTIRIRKQYEYLTATLKKGEGDG